VQWDKSYFSAYVKDPRLDDDQLTGLYYNNDLAKTIVDAQLDEAFRVGYEINLPDDADNSDKDVLDVWKPAIDTAVRDNRRWSRLFGGASIYLDVEDGLDITEPLDISKVKKINSLRVFDRRFVWPLGYDTDPTSPTYWLPEFYGFGGSLVGSLASPRVHHSRLLRSVGLEADRRESQYLFWWGHSVLQPVYQALLRLGLTEQATAVMMQDATQFIFYVKGLLDAIASKDYATVQARYHAVDMARGVGRSLLLDAGMTGQDAEKAEKLTTPFTGVKDILVDVFMARVAAAAGIPVSVLFGTGFGGGLSDKGEGDLRAWHSKVKGYQTRELEADLRALYALVGEVEGVDTSNMKFVWKSLYEPSAAERGALYFQVAQGDEIYMTAGALRPEEVALSRFGAGEYSMETTIDPDMYRASLAAAPAPEPAAPAGQPPAPGAPGGAAVGQPPNMQGASAGPVQPPTMVTGAAKPATEGPTVAEHPEQNPSNNQVIGKSSPTESPLAPGEVGGSNRMTEPQITDITGRGTPNGEKQANKIPAGASGVNPDNTPVQGKQVPSHEETPASDTVSTADPGQKHKVALEVGGMSVKVTSSPADPPKPKKPAGK
jgi:phage-related protein (TIGR01555 family)